MDYRPLSDGTLAKIGLHLDALGGRQRTGRPQVYIDVRRLNGQAVHRARPMAVKNYILSIGCRIFRCIFVVLCNLLNEVTELLMLTAKLMPTSGNPIECR
jgi:hypothetical protein